MEGHNRLEPEQGAQLRLAASTVVGQILIAYPVIVSLGLTICLAIRLFGGQEVGTYGMTDSS